MTVKMSNSNRFQRRSDFEIAGLYDLEKTIGKGHFAVVKLARHVFTNEKVAVKVIDKTKLDDISKSHLFQEVRCMKLVQHPNVVRLYEVIDTQTKLYLILELGDGGDMYDYIMKHDKGLPEDKARRYFRQIVEAISYCHKLHVVHRDLKPENVVFFEKLGIVKLTDFGFSNMFNPGKKLETSCGSLAYSAPEILLGDSYDAPAVDVWSLGVILFMLVCGVPPFQEANDSETLTMIMDCKYLVPEHISSACKDLIHKMLQREPVHRAKLGDILNHEWLCMGDYIAPTVPLISREHLSDDDHNYLIEKMVEGNIATKDEILLSLDRDLYDHITATYYLLAERKLKRHHQEMALAQIRKHSAPADHSSPAHSMKPNLELSLSPRVQSKEQKEEQLRRPKTSIVQSLVSPPGTHPTPSTTPDSQSRGSRKFSLIQEESIDDDEEEEELMDIDPGELRPAKSVESLDDGLPWKGSNQNMQSFEPFHVKRPLMSVASSPQLLNQICEENETDVEEEDDFVPNKLHSPKLRMSRGSCASPEVLRKYEQRKKRSGSKVTSCSSSDASDTDDTEKRSRKDKLKPKFMHRRDSSDHSSDTDGGPSGPPTGGLGGGRAATGGGGKDRSSNKDRKGGGGSKGHKEGKSGGGGGKHHTHSCRSKSGESSISSAISNLSMTSINSKNSLKYIVEGDESNDSDVEDNDMKTDDKEELRARNYIDKVCDKENKICEEVFLPCPSDCSVYQGRKVYGNRLKIKVDINRNSCCNVQDSKLHPIKIQTKCCSLV